MILLTLMLLSFVGLPFIVGGWLYLIYLEERRR